MDSVEVMRRAADVLRERAAAARNMTGAGDWFAAPVSPVFAEWNVRSSGGRVAGDTSAEEATYIATMHPGVGLALADALDETAETWRLMGAPEHSADEHSEFVHLAHLIIGTRL